MSGANRSVVLCVDDEPNLLAGLSLHLRREYEVLTATSGAAGLELLQARPEVAAVISDMRMPAMDGALFLSRARKLVPNTTRILLTGFADLDAAIRAVNKGHLFRFLTKPCPPEELKIVVKAAVAQHRLVLAERELLEQTLYGSLEALSEALVLAVPEVYGSLFAVRRLTEELGRIADLEPVWPLRIASMLVFVGFVNLPREIAMRAVAGDVLTAQEAAMVAQAPQTAERLLERIPRLEMVRAIIRLALDDDPVLRQQSSADSDDLIRESASLLRLAMDFHRRTGAKLTDDEVLQQMREQGSRYPRHALDCLAQYLGEIRDQAQMDVATNKLRVGMTLAEGLRTRHDVLVAAKGHVVTENFLARLANFPKDSLVDTVRVRWGAKTGQPIDTHVLEGSQ